MGQFLYKQTVVCQMKRPKIAAKWSQHLVAISESGKMASLFTTGNFSVAPRQLQFRLNYIICKKSQDLAIDL